MAILGMQCRLSWKAFEATQSDSGSVRDTKIKTAFCGSRTRVIFCPLYALPTPCHPALLSSCPAKKSAA